MNVHFRKSGAFFFNRHEGTGMDRCFGLWCRRRGRICPLECSWESDTPLRPRLFVKGGGRKPPDVKTVLILEPIRCPTRGEHRDERAAGQCRNSKQDHDGNCDCRHGLQQGRHGPKLYPNSSDIESPRAVRAGNRKENGRSAGSESNFIVGGVISVASQPQSEERTEPVPKILARQRL